MTYTLGVTYNVPVSIKTCLPPSLIASGPESSSSHGVVGTSYLSTLKLAWKQQEQATHPWPETSYLAPPESQKPKPPAQQGSKDGGWERAGWSPHGLSTSGWKMCQDQQCGPWQSPAEFPQHCGHQGLVLSFWGVDLKLISWGLAHSWSSYRTRDWQSLC